MRSATVCISLSPRPESVTTSRPPAGRKCMDRKRLLRNPLLWIAAVLLLYFVFTVLFDDSRGYTQVPTSQALTQVAENNVSNATIEDKEQRLRLTLTDGTTFEGSNRLITQFPASSTDEIFTVLDQAQNKPTVETKVSQESILMQILIYLVPLGLLLMQPLRYRRLPPGIERQQIKWAGFGFAAGSAVAPPRPGAACAPPLRAGPASGAGAVSALRAIHPVRRTRTHVPLRETMFTPISFRRSARIVAFGRPALRSRAPLGAFTRFGNESRPGPSRGRRRTTTPTCVTT